MFKYYVFHDRFIPVVPTMYFDDIDLAIEYFNNLILMGNQWIALGIQTELVNKTTGVCFDLVHKHPGQFFELINDYQNHGEEFIPIKEHIESKLNIHFQFDSKIYRFGSLLPYDKDYKPTKIDKKILKVNEVYISSRKGNENLGWMTLNELEKRNEFDYLNHPIIYHVNVQYEIKGSSDSGQMDMDARDYRQYLLDNK